MGSRRLPSLGLLAALGLFAATPVLAAGSHSSVGLQFGRTVPTHDFSHSATAGFEGGLQATYMESDHVGVGVDLAYHRWNRSDELDARFSALLGAGSDVRFSAIQASVHMIVDLMTGERARPFVKAGIGLYWPKTMIHSPLGDLDGTETRIGYSLGAGARVRVSAMDDVAVAAIYHAINDGGGSEKLFTVGASFLWGLGRP